MRRVVVRVVIVMSVALAACTPGDKGSTGSNSSTTVDDRAVSSSVPPTTVDDDGDVPNPAVTEAKGGSGQAGGGFRYDVTQFGYQEKEYFFDGTAKTYAPSALPPAPYRSRMIVWTPSDPERFNGTTVVEWAEVSDFGQFELTVELNYQAPMLEREGFAFSLHHLDEASVRRTPSRDRANHVTWEVIGAPHADRWAGDHTHFPSSRPKPKLTRDEEEALRVKFDDFGPDPEPPSKICFPGRKTGNMFPRRFTLNAALLAVTETATGSGVQVRSGAAMRSRPEIPRSGWPA